MKSDLGVDSKYRRNRKQPGKGIWFCMEYWIGDAMLMMEIFRSITIPIIFLADVHLWINQ